MSLALLLLPQAPSPGKWAGDGRTAPPAREWVDPRHTDLVATWEAVAPPGAVGFAYPQGSGTP